MGPRKREEKRRLELLDSPTQPTPTPFIFLLPEKEKCEPVYDVPNLPQPGRVLFNLDHVPRLL
jgi:hypothetical protein